jgi:hypothetical protein
MAGIRFRLGVPYLINDDGSSRQLTFWTSASAGWNPPNLTSGTQTTTFVAVTGALLGQPALASFSLDLQGLQMSAYVTSSDIVRVVLRNDTGGAINLGSGTLTASVATFV